MRGAESLAFLFVNVPIGGPESRGWTSGRVAAREKMMFEHMYSSLKCQLSLFSQIVCDTCEKNVECSKAPYPLNMAACTVIRSFYVNMCLQIFNNDFEMQKKGPFYA